MTIRRASRSHSASSSGWASEPIRGCSNSSMPSNGSDRWAWVPPTPPSTPPTGCLAGGGRSSRPPRPRPGSSLSRTPSPRPVETARRRGRDRVAGDPVRPGRDCSCPPGCPTPGSVSRSRSTASRPVPGTTVSYAVRWHGERPALLWEQSGDPVELTAPILAPDWATSELTGEALWPTPPNQRSFT